MKQHLLTLAGYHHWAFETLYTALLPIGDQHYRNDCGLFFRSIHGTLNHLLLADRVWFGRFSGESYPVASLGQELEHDRARLEQALYADTPRWQHWIAEQSESRLNGVLSYSNLSGTTFQNPLTPVLLHVFNHATHHRGQISAGISSLGFEVPEMDLIMYLRRPSDEVS